MKNVVGHFMPLGGGNEIGRSMYALIFLDLKKIFIIDCGFGMRPASKGKDNIILPEKLEEFVKWINPTYMVCVCFSHGHNDHIGAAVKLYNLLKERNLKVTYFATEPTRGLIEVMGGDGIGIREKNELPLHYERNDLNEFLEAIQIVPSSDWINLENDCRIRFEPSGHIRGAASILLETPYGIFLYSGDINFYDTTTVRGASRKFPGKVRWLAMDSTNGDLTLPDPKDEKKRLANDLREIIKGGGHAILPAIASRGEDIGIYLGRELKEELLNGLAELFMGGLMQSTTRICHHTHWESDIPFAGEGEKHSFNLRKENIQWLTPYLTHLDKIRKNKIPAIVVASNGMLQTRYSRYFAYYWGSDPKNAIFLINYQAEETQGRRILKLKNGEDFTISADNGEKLTIPLLAQIKKYGFSGHADQPQLTSWVQSMDPHDSQSLDLAILVHGDRKGQYYLSEKLRLLPNRPKEIRIGINNRVIPLYA